MRNLLSIFIIFAIVLSARVNATIIEIPGEYQTIQAAYDASSSNDTLLVDQGIYYEYLYLEAHRVMITSHYLFSNDPADIAGTIIDADGAQHALGIYHVYDGMIIHGLTLTGASEGGAHVRGSEYTLSSLLITNNTAEFGAAIHLHNTTTTLLNCELAYNTAVACSGIRTQNSTLNMYGCRVHHNSCEEDGGGMRIYESSVYMEDCQFDNNSAGIWGGAIDNMYDSNLTLRNVALLQNQVELGGALFIYDAQTTLINVTISDNYATDYGGGIRFYDYPPVIFNSVIWNNEPGGLVSGAPVYFSDIDGGYDGEGNINMDPLFVNPTGLDYHLNDNSPCIDAGIDFFIVGIDTVLNIPENEFEGFMPDMGAFEHPDVVVRSPREEPLPHSTIIVTAYPNPFNSEQKVRIFIPQTGLLNVSVYDLLGRKVTCLLNEYVESGLKTVCFNAGNWSSGTYTIVSTGSQQQVSTQVILVK